MPPQPYCMNPMTKSIEVMPTLVDMRHRYVSLASSFSPYFIKEVNGRIGMERKRGQQSDQPPSLPTQSNARIRTIQL